MVSGMGVTIVASPDPGQSLDLYLLFLRTILMAILIPVLIRSREDIRLLLLAMAFALGLLGLRFGLYGIVRGGARFDSGLGGFMSDNNTLALGLAMAVPLCWASFRNFARPTFRPLYLAFTIGTCFAVVWTHSRGGALALAFALFTIIQAERRKLLLFLVLALTLPIAVWMVKESYFDRLETLLSPTEEASAATRLSLAKAAIQIWLDHPIIGVGFGSVGFQKLVGNYLGFDNSQVAHNTYLQVAADCGTPVFAMYISLMIAVIFKLGRSASRIATVGTGLDAYPICLRGSLICFVIGSIFLSRVTFDLYYFLLMSSVSWFHVEREIRAGQGLKSGSPASAVASIKSEGTFRST
jgi:probable O-glycosylation ligase (exosortase A-associated)